METPAGNSRQPRPGCPPGPPDPIPARARGRTRVRGAIGGSRATVLGSLTIPGRPEQVAFARAFVARTLGSNQIGADADEATLLTSEIVTNAIQHSKSGIDGGTVTIVVIRVAHGVLVEIIDHGSAGAPIVKGDLYAVQGHGLFLVQHLAAQWGYLRNSAGTTVWFHLPAGDQQPAGQQPPRDADRSAGQPGKPDESAPDTGPYRTRPGEFWAAAMPSTTALPTLAGLPRTAGRRESFGRMGACPRRQTPTGQDPG